jgi:hypothetical protein
MWEHCYLFSVFLSFFLSFYFAGLSRYPTGGLKVTRKSIVCLVIFVLTELGWGTILKAMPCTCLQWRGLATKEEEEKGTNQYQRGGIVLEPTPVYSCRGPRVLIESSSKDAYAPKRQKRWMLRAVAWQRVDPWKHQICKSDTHYHARRYPKLTQYSLCVCICGCQASSVWIVLTALCRLALKI